MSYTDFGDEWDDEWYGVNKRCNPQCHNNLQRYR